MDDFIIILATIFSGISIILFCVVLKIVLIDLPKIEKQINKLHKEKEEKIRSMNKDYNVWYVSEEVKEMFNNEIEDYDLQIEGLERERRFLLDKLPFFKR